MTQQNPIPPATITQDVVVTNLKVQGWPQIKLVTGNADSLVVEGFHIPYQNGFHPPIMFWGSRSFLLAGDGINSAGEPCTVYREAVPSYAIIPDDFFAGR